jgi:anti-anti-sigma factor
MNIISYLDKQGKLFKLATGFALLATIGILDLLTGHELAVSLFYLIPVSFVAWFLGRCHGIVASLAAALVLLAVDISTGHPFHFEIIIALNALIRFSLFVLASWFLSTLKNAMAREEDLASTDYLTGAANSRRFFKLLKMECERLHRYGRPFTLAYMDLDNFKDVNDQFGHPAGDQALCTVVRYAREHLRAIDVVARLGGDELAFLLPESHPESARLVLEKLRAGLREEMKRNNWPITFSIGAVICNRDVPMNSVQLVQIADKLMYSVKNNGKDGVAYMTYEGNVGETPCRQPLTKRVKGEITMEFKSLNKLTGVTALPGNLAAESEDGLKNIAAEAVKRGMQNLILDLRPLDHMNSAGTSVLVKLAAAAKKQQLKLLVFGLNRRYREIFSLTGLSEAIAFIEEKADESVILSDEERGQLKKAAVANGRQDDRGWAPDIDRLKVTEHPAGAMDKNVDGRRVLGPLQGFGPMWQKTYLLPINKPGMQPAEVIEIMRNNFPAFQPPENDFYATGRGITAGEVVLIDSSTPGGIVSTGVLVSYSDETSFTLITPEGHPEAGWVTFSAAKRGDFLEMQIQGLARASDPLYELAFRIAGSKLQESIWRHVLSSLAAYLQVEPAVQVTKICIADDLQWEKTGNLWYSAQIRSLPWNIPRLFSKPPKSARS